MLLLSPLKPMDLVADVEWGTLLFFVGRFILVGGLVKVGALDTLARQLAHVAGAVVARGRVRPGQFTFRGPPITISSDAGVGARATGLHRHRAASSCRGTVFAITLPLASVAKAAPPVEPGSEAPERRRQNSAPEDNPSPK